MPAVYDLDSDIYFGGVEKPLPNWRDFSDDDVDDVELENTPQDVIAVLGFDPKEFLDEPDDEKGGPGSGPRAGVPRGPYKKKPEHEEAQAPTLDQLKSKYSELTERYQRVHQEELDVSSKTRSGTTPEQRLPHYHELARTSKEKSNIEYELVTTRMTAEAADPVLYKKVRDEYLEKKKAWDREDLAYIKKLQDSGVVNKEYVNTVSASDIAGDHYGFGMEYALEKYPGLTEELYKEAQGIYSRRPKLDHGAYQKPYYGETAPMRDLGNTLPRRSDPAVPAGVLKRSIGGDSDPVLDRFCADSNVYVAMKSKSFETLLSSRDGSFKNGFQRGAVGSISKDELGNTREGYFSKRKESEEQVLGISKTSPASTRPIYGYVQHPDRLNSQAAHMTGHYGPVQVKLKDEVKTRTSITFGDSIDDANRFGFKATSLSDPVAQTVRKEGMFRDVSDEHYGRLTPGEIRVLNESGKWKLQTKNAETGEVQHEYSLNYVEAQIHGTLSLKQIEEIRIPKYFKLSEDARTKLNILGINVVEIQPPHVYSSYGQPWDRAVKEY